MAAAQFYVSVQGKGVAHGFLLSTGRYSMFDLGNATKDEIRIHSPEKVMDYFLFVGPSPAAVIAQMTSISGRPRPSQYSPSSVPEVRAIRASPVVVRGGRGMVAGPGMDGLRGSPVEN